ncbi:thioredoxin domain-containing protein [Thiomicrospira sp. WB1]|uniref:thioredoxin domain-containing protein n=1 Tax=Thiomicrospira sp. WB1 TaxID=1685380 RepID=UPI0013657418|nr:DUF255 domain-containing protein [Thiomicrospira sp. WB1]
MAVAMLALKPGTALALTTNALKDHPSAYLAMHGEDPVDWQVWSPDLFDRAQARDKLILLSSGYYACHWCHVMQADNYQSPEIAAYLNQHFISVKIDRELQPALDQNMLDTARVLAGHAGWPQHLILTPEGDPFVAFVYQPPDDFQQTLRRSVRTWQNAPQRIRTLVAKARQTAQPSLDLSLPERMNAETFAQRLTQQLRQKMDDFSGGLEGTNKFPQAPLLQTVLSLLIEQTTLANRASINDWLLTTLEQMQNQHLQDHVHGGFFRYTVDPEWQTPHFEKMLYTQALLARLYFDAGTYFDRPDFTTTAQRTLNYVQNTLFQPDIGLAIGSQSALDHQGVEGGNYLWSRQALTTQIRPQLEQNAWGALTRAWSLDETPPFKAGWLPKPTPALMPHWPEIRTQIGCSRTQPPLDNKAVLGWNGLLLSAYAAAIQHAPDVAALETGKKLAQALWDQWQGDFLPAAMSTDAPSETIGQAQLTDQTHVLSGLQDWLNATKDAGRTRLNPQGNSADWLAEKRQTLIRRYHRNQSWYTSDQTRIALHAAPPLLSAQVLPSPSAQLPCQALSPAETSQAWARPLEHADTYHRLRCAEIRGDSALEQP